VHAKGVNIVSATIDDGSLPVGKAAPIIIATVSAPNVGWKFTTVQIIYIAAMPRQAGQAGSDDLAAEIW
jgi:hypothetical protein